MKRLTTIFFAFMLLIFYQLNTNSLMAGNFSSDVESTFVKGDKVLNLGVGLGRTFGWGSTTIPPISASLEVGIIDDFLIENLTLGIGGYAGYTASRYRWGGDWGWNYTYIIVGGRGVVHYPLIEKLDTYTGAMLGINIHSSKWQGSRDYYTDAHSGGGLIFSWFAGGRYYFSDNLAVMGEIGYGISWITLGVSLKL